MGLGGRLRKNGGRGTMSSSVGFRFSGVIFWGLSGLGLVSSEVHK
jgi:hypothetical protein